MRCNSRVEVDESAGFVRQSWNSVEVDTAPTVKLHRLAPSPGVCRPRSRLIRIFLLPFCRLDGCPRKLPMTLTRGILMCLTAELPASSDYSAYAMTAPGVAFSR